jgi:hypothetical protein
MLHHNFNMLSHDQERFRDSVDDMLVRGPGHILEDPSTSRFANVDPRSIFQNWQKDLWPPSEQASDGAHWCTLYMWKQNKSLIGERNYDCCSKYWKPLFGAHWVVINIIKL